MTTYTYAEKFLQHNSNENKIIRISEWKLFPYDFNILLRDIHEYVTDNFEDFQEHNIYYNLSEEFSTADADELLNWVEDIIEVRKDTDEYDDDGEWLKKWIQPLKEASGFTLHLDMMPDWAKHSGNTSYQNNKEDKDVH